MNQNINIDTTINTDTNININTSIDIDTDIDGLNMHDPHQLGDNTNSQEKQFCTSNGDDNNHNQPPLSTHNLHEQKKQILCFLGAPGAGKGTQISNLKAALDNEYSIRHFSPGEEMRKRGMMNAHGGLADESIVNKLLDEALSEDIDIIMIDGYPRSITQAEYIKQYLENKQLKMHVFIFSVSYNAILQRLAIRSVCPACGYIGTKNEGDICIKCGANMTYREDDASNNAIMKRYTIFSESINNITDIFNECEYISICNIDAADNQDIVFEALFSKIKILYQKES